MLVATISTASFAHSKINKTVPMNESIVSATPEKISFTFEKPIRLVTMKLSIDEGDKIDLDISAFKSFEEFVEIPLENLGAGNYMIEWRGLGKDGHTATGTLSFVVDPEITEELTMVDENSDVEMDKSEMFSKEIDSEFETK